MQQPPVRSTYGFTAKDPVLCDEFADKFLAS